MTTIGMYIQGELDRLQTTLAGLDRYTPGTRVILLHDCGEPALPASYASFPCLTGDVRGAPAAFNRLIACEDAPLVVFLQNGIMVTAGWLERLIAALEEEEIGLAGPSTNFTWNEQRLPDAPPFGARQETIDAYATEVAARFGSDIATLEPLYSLADFCFVVKREVVTAIGGADQGYGTGPCWEMDYSIRAARAGFQGVWVKGAYVHRPPHSARRIQEERAGFAASKRLYQDKFCGLRLRGEKKTYERHCCGDACPHFAPLHLISLQLPPPAKQIQGSPIEKPLPLVTAMPSPGPLVYTVPSPEPLVSCIMPTHNRRPFLPRAIRCFQQQDYPHLELIVVDDSTDQIEDCLPDDPRIRYVRLESNRTIGEKRNIACEQARGEIIVHWDDDDWYPSRRITAQVRALLDRRGDVCGSSQVLYYEPAGDRAWRYQYVGAGAPWVAGNTLGYRRCFWEARPFAPLQIGEDSRFINGARRGSLIDLADPTLCVATIHPANTSRKMPRGLYWHRESVSRIHQLLSGDLPPGSVPVTAPHSAGHPEMPLVSCIMPTYNRRPFIRLAITLFIQQDYPDKELIVVDDGSDAVGDLVEGHAGVRYIRIPGRRSIGAKRNLACAEARGEIIAHWDDDDWYGPERLRYQMAPILAGEADLSGLVNTFVLEAKSGQFWTTRPELHRRMFTGDVHGGTLVFRRDLLERGLTYPEVNIAEDAWLIHRALGRGKRLARLANPGVFVYVRHGRNAWRFDTGRFLDPAGWEQITPPDSFPMSSLLEYQAAGALV